MPSKPPVHRPPGVGDRKQERQAYDQRRGSARQRGYTASWDVASRSFLADPDNVLCVGCLAVGRVAVATVTDHIIPHRGDMRLFWDRANWQGSCRPHHDIVKPRLEAMFDRGEIDAAALRLSSIEAQRLTTMLMRA